MSSTSGLSSNTSNNNPASNPLKLDAAARESIQAQNQARVLASIGILKKDSFNSGNAGLNPLKGLYSAAAATFLKNKQGHQGGVSDEKKDAYETSATAVKKLSTQASSSSDSFQNTNSKVSGPDSGGSYKKYQWTGKPGPTGSDVINPDVPVDETPAVEPPAKPVDLDPVTKALQGVISDGGGTVSNQDETKFDFKVLDIAGTVTKTGDHLSGTVNGESGSYSFTIKADGGVVIDASKGNTVSEEFDQIKHLLSGSLDGAKRKTVAPPPADPAPAVADPTPPPASSTPPADPTPPPVGQTPEEKAAADKAAADKAAADKAAADKAAADKAAADAAESDDLSKALTSSTLSLASLLASGKSSDRGRYNAKLLITDIQAAGGAVAVKDSKTLNITLNGQAGTLQMQDDKLVGTLGTGKGKINFEIKGNGDMKIRGDDKDSTAKANSLNLRKAIGASTSVGTDFEARVVKFNRYGTGTGLNLLA